MAACRVERFLFLLILLLAVNHLTNSQNYYITKQIPTDCKQGPSVTTHEFYDISQLRCTPCAQASTLQTVSSDGLKCICQSNSKIVEDYGGGNIRCEACPSGKYVSENGWECVACNTGGDTSTNCPACTAGSITVERLLNGSYSFERTLNGTVPDPNSPARICDDCAVETAPNYKGTRCERCSQVLSVLPTQYDCQCPNTQLTGGICFASPSDIVQNVVFVVPFSAAFDSEWQFHHLKAAYGMCQQQYGNLTACQSLGNMCVMLMYKRDNAGRASERDACSLYLDLKASAPPSTGGPTEWPQNMPWLYYEQETADKILTDTKLTTPYTFPNSKLDFIAAMYSYNGSYLGMQSATNGLLQFCKNTQAYLDAAYSFGTKYSQSCEMKISELYNMETVYYDLYLNSTINNVAQLYAVPVRVLNYKESGQNVNQGTDQTTWKLVRRFTMVDTVSGIKYDEFAPPTTRPTAIWYAQDITFNIQLQEGQSAGLIYPPYITINYAETGYDATKSVTVTFKVEYNMIVTKYNNDIAIAVGVLSALAIVYSFIQTFAWNKRAGQIAIDFLTMIKFLLFICGNLANVFFVVTLGSALWWWAFFKRQNSVYLLLPSSSQEQQFIAFLASAFALKTIQLLALVIAQVSVDIFFIDWERPRGKVIASNDAAQKGQEAPVSIWRTYFVANEWNEIQTTRKINNVFQIFAVIFFLHVVGFENLATSDPQNGFNLDDGNYHSETSRMLRYAIGALCYLLIAVVQWIFYTFIYERFIEDKIRQYVDLCSMSNVSVIIMENNLFGYYIHGRSVHGRSDTGLREMAENMKREEEDLCGQRGLMPNTEQQTFQIALPRKLRSQYDKVMMPITQTGQGGPQATANRTTTGNQNSHLDSQTEKCVQAYGIINRFMQAFIDHSLRDIDYFVKDKNLLESILNSEFQDTTEKGHFYNDNGHGFDQVLFFGHETTLTIFSILFFSIIDLIFQNFVLAAVLTYLLDEIILMIRDSLGRSNLAKKTLVDKRFLI